MRIGGLKGSAKDCLLLNVLSNTHYVFPRVNQKRIAVISQRRQLAWY